MPSMIGLRIREAREARGWSWRDLSKQLGWYLQPHTIEKFESGKGYPTKVEFGRIALAFGMSPDELRGSM